MAEDLTRHLSATWPPAYPRHRAVDTARARALDAAASDEFAIPSVVLMEHASRGVAEIAAQIAPPGGQILVCCGPGNNGGDGFGAARFLRSWGREVRVLQMSRSRPGSPDAQLEVALAENLGPIEDAWAEPELVWEALEAGPGLVIDALFGVGLTRPLEAPYTVWIERLNTSGVPILAVDVPSGMHTDTGAPLPICVDAHVTATMAAPKLGFADGAPGAEAAGHVVEVDIGLPRSLLSSLEL